MKFAPYDAIAYEYYDEFHKTCRNFDKTTQKALLKIKADVPKEGLVLDVGCGRGRCNEYLDIDLTRVVQLDSSEKMLNLKEREECLLKIHHQAEELPFLKNTFNCITSFLCDPFLGLDFLSEVHRVLSDNGLFIATTPAFEWGTSLRQKMTIDIAETRFLKLKGGEVKVPSVLATIEQVTEMLVRGGFDRTKINIEKHYLPEGTEPISKDILDAAKNLNRNISELELIYLIVVRK